VIIAGSAIWTVTRVEGLQEGNASALIESGVAQEHRGISDEMVKEAGKTSELSQTNEGVSHFALAAASPAGSDLELTIAECRKTIEFRPDDADAHCKLGTLLIVQGKLDQAITALREATRIKPGRTDAHCKLGRAFSALGMLDEAVAELRETIRLEPGNLDAHKFLGETFARQGKIDEATAQYVEVDRLKFDPSVALSALKSLDNGATDPSDSQAHKIDRDADTTAPDSSKTRADVDTAATGGATGTVPTGPQSAAGFYNRSIDLAERDEYDRAIADLNEAIRLDSKFAAAYIIRGEIRLKTNELDKAIADLDAAVRLDPHGRAYNVRGLIRARKKEYDKAIYDYSEAIALDPEDARSYYGRGYVWAAKKDYEKAIIDFNSAIRHDALFAAAYVARAHVHSTQKSYDLAIADFDDAIRLDPTGASAHTGRAYAWSQKKHYEKAVADYNEAIRLDSQDSGALNGRAWLASTCPESKYRDGKKAIETATRACELTKWKRPMLLDTLAAAYAESGDFESARKWQTRAIELLTDESDQDEIRKRIELYQRGLAYRE
jgi:tetratricopeptide (TPR) repeat protein